MVPVFVFFAAGAMLYTFSNKAAESFETAGYMEKIALSTSNLIILTYEYNIAGRARPRIQWINEHDALERMLKQGRERFVEQDEKAVYADIAVGSRAVGAFFSELLEFDERMRASGVSFKNLQEREDRVNRLVLELNSLIPAINKLSYEHFANAKKHSEIATFFYFSMFLLLVCALPIFSLLTIKRIYGSIAKFQSGIQTVAKGDLEGRVNLPAIDEIGLLAKGFDEMTERLREITVGRDKLQEEIAERKKAEAELQRWANIFEHAQWGAAVVNADGKTLDAMNQAFAGMHGAVVEELAGKPLENVVEAERRSKLQRHINYAVEKGHHTFETMHLRKDGSAFPTFVDITAVKDGNGEVLCFALNAQDISERKRIEKEIRKTAREWTAAIDASADVICLMDLDQSVIRANRAFYEMLGLKQETALGRHIASIIHPLGEKIPCPACNALEKKMDSVFTMEAGNPSNPAGKPIEVSLTVIRDADENPVSMMMILHDLTRERKVREDLRKYHEQLEETVKSRTAELEEKNAELERLNKLFVGRELRMIQLKHKIADLEKSLDEVTRKIA